MEWNGAPRTTLMHSRNHSDAASAALRHLASSSTVRPLCRSVLPPSRQPIPNNSPAAAQSVQRPPDDEYYCEDTLWGKVVKVTLLG